MTGQSVLIHGAAGGVGSIAVQLAHEVGARVIGTGWAGARDTALGLGADAFVYLQAEKLEGASPIVPVVLNRSFPHCRLLSCRRTVLCALFGRGLLYGPGRGGAQGWSGASAEVSDAEWFAGRQGDLVRSREGVGSYRPFGSDEAVLFQAQAQAQAIVFVHVVAEGLPYMYATERADMYATERADAALRAVDVRPA